MKKNQTTRILSLIGALGGAIAFFCLFAAAFTEEQISVRGNLFAIMFPSARSGYAIVVPLVIAMAVLCLAFVSSLVAAFLNEKAKRILSIVNAVLYVAVAVAFLFTTDFYLLANQGVVDIYLQQTGKTSIGAGPICVAVFSFLAAACCLAIPFLRLPDQNPSGKSIRKN